MNTTETIHYKLRSVGTDVEPIAEAWVVKNDDWNGFAIPLFDKENALKVAEANKELIRYDEKTDTFVEIFNADWHESEDDLEEWKGGYNKELGIKVYSIGAASWTWGTCDTDQDSIHVNSYGEFDKGCTCGNGDFYTVDKKVDSEWHEIDPIEGAEWRGWGCIACNRVFDGDGKLIAHPEKIEWLEA